MSKHVWQQIDDIYNTNDSNLSIAQSEYVFVQSIYDSEDMDKIIEVEEYYGDGMHIVLRKLLQRIDRLKEKQ